MNNAIKEALSFDPLSAAEEITGESYKKDEPTSMLGLFLHMDHAQNKQKLLKEAGDTYFSMKIPEFLNFLRGLGFEELLRDDVPDSDTAKGNKYRIWWRAGVLVAFDSYWGDESVNGGSAHFCFEGPRSAMFSCSNGWVEGTDPYVWRGNFDVREGFRYRLDRMEAEGKLLPKWPARDFLWLLHYMDSKQEGYDHEAITAARIARFPAHVQAAITP
jgi:hypothetical protein